MIGSFQHDCSRLLLQTIQFGIAMSLNYVSVLQDWLFTNTNPPPNA